MASGDESEPNDATDGRELPEKLALTSRLSQPLSLHHHSDSFWDSSPETSPEAKRAKAEHEPAVEKEVSHD